MANGKAKTDRDDTPAPVNGSAGDKHRTQFEWERLSESGAPTNGSRSNCASS